MGAACDVRDPAAVRAVFAALPAPAHVLVNAAGIADDALLLRATDAAIAATLHTNLAGAIYTSRAALRGMLRAGGKETRPALAPAIVHVGSVVGELGNAGQTVYAASKAGLVGFTRALAAEVGPRGVRVNMVAPGFIDTDMTAALDAAVRERILARTALRRFGTPADVADAVEVRSRPGWAGGGPRGPRRRQCSLRTSFSSLPLPRVGSRAQYLLRAQYVTGQVLTVDGGLSVGVVP